MLQGTYQFTNVLDLGAKFSGVIFESIIRFEGFSDSTLFDNYVPAVVLNSDGAILSGCVDALTSFDGDVLENATAELQIQTSDDNSSFTTANDFNEASFGSLMIDMVAYIGDILSFYLDFYSQNPQ